MFAAPIALTTILLNLLLVPSFPLVWSFKKRITNFKLLLYHFYRVTINTQDVLAQNSCFSPSAHKSSVTSAPVKNVSSFSSNSANSLCSRACLGTCKVSSNPKSNLILKYNSKSHILPVSFKSAIPVSVSNFCVSSTLSNSSGAMVQKHSFDSHSFKSTSFTNSASQLSFFCSKFSSPKIPTTPKSSISVPPTNHNNFSSSIPYFIKSNDSKPACAPPQTCHLSPFSIKSSRRLFQSSTKACQSIISRNQKVFNSASLFS